MGIEEANKTLTEGCEKIVPSDGLMEKLKIAEIEGRPLLVKLGFDPTAPDLHLGHAVVLKKLRQFQDLGHRVVVIVGDFTAYIGDPTGKNKSRPPIDEEQIKKNADTYVQQLSKILDLSKLEIRFNSEWFNQVGLRDMIKLIANVTLAQIIERNDFQQRYREGVPISMHELMYPILQGYDSLVIDSDVEIGGTDQLFNILIGRRIQETRERIGQIALCMPLLRGTDGTEKMSKSLGNYIALTDSPDDMYGKVMSIPDSLIVEYIDLATSFSGTEKQELKRRLTEGENPMKVKKAIALNVVEQYYDKNSAQEAERYFYRQVQDKSLESKEYEVINLQDLELPKTNLSLLDLCASIESQRSRTNVRNMIKSGAIAVNGVKVTDISFKLSVVEDETLLKIGKRGYYRIIVIQ